MNAVCNQIYRFIKELKHKLLNEQMIKKIFFTKVASLTEMGKTLLNFSSIYICTFAFKTLLYKFGKNPGWFMNLINVFKTLTADCM